MERISLCLLLGFTQALSSVHAQTIGDWREANDRVHQAGGWKAYARERADTPRSAPPSGSTKAASLTLDQAIERARALSPQIARNLVNVSRVPADYPRLTDAQRSAITEDQHLVSGVTTLFYQLLADRDRVALRAEAAELSAIAEEVITRMRKAGNTNDLHAGEMQLAAAKSQEAVSAARLSLVDAKEALALRLQLSGTDPRLDLTGSLPVLPKQLAALSTIDQRLLSFFSESPEVLKRQAAVRKALALRDEAHRMARLHQDRVLPLQQKISEETLLHYNGMIVGVFELLKDAEHHVSIKESHIDALLRYWKSEAELIQTLTTLKEYLVNLRRDAWN
jgi:hypothetical protein